MSTRRNGRAVALVNSAIAVSLVALLAVVALVVKPPAPPGIAEFAPQASKPITKAPPGQASQFGQGAGRCLAGQSCAPVAVPTTRPPSAAPTSGPVKGVPSALQCYEWPDGSVTQTFDPQSPPCIASWEDADKGNGGATYQGVTGSEIRVTLRRSAVTRSATDTIGSDPADYVNGLIRFFNSRYQLYGRHFKLVFNDGDSPDSPSKANAAASSALYVEPFAVLATLTDDAGFIRKIAANKTVVVSDSVANASTAAQMVADGPYAWSYEPPDDLVQSNFAAFVCSSLAGKNARFSPDYGTVPRNFVIVNMSDADGSLARDPGPLLAGLKQRCRLAPRVVTLKNDDKTRQSYTQFGTQMKTDGVTTVLSLVPCCNEEMQTGAQSASWRPEWAYYGKQRQYPVQAQSDMQNATATSELGLGPRNKVLPEREEPYVQVSQATRGSRSETIYHDLAMLAAGVQMAGPVLTPQTMGAGLHATTFPNPGAGRAPSFQAAAGFPGQETWMLRDFNVWWPDTTRRSSQANQFPLCYVGQGRRFSLDAWPDLERQIHSGGGCS